MSIIFHESSKTFHLYNNNISYIMTVLPNGHLGNLYFGKRIHDREDFSYLLEMKQRAMTACVYEGNRKFSLEHLKLEYPVYGSSDYRYPAVEILQENGSRISEFTYVSHTVTDGKPKLSGLPATYTENDEEAQTLCVKLKDEVTGIVLELLYTIFAQGGIITRSARFTNEGTSLVHLLNAMSLSLDLPDKDYVWMQFSGAWSRERHVKERRLEQGIQSVGSIRGNSSHEHNPFIVLRRPSATENAGEVMGFSLIYSGNHRMQAEVDTHDTTRITVGINPQNFDWKLDCGESFQTPEAVVVFSDKGLNGMSQTFHKLYQKRLARGYWRDRPRPILNNNWEATYFDFTEDRLVEIAAKAKECGVELFVLDDGWFGARSNDHAGLGDWVANRERLPRGIKGIADRIEEMGMKFGLWFEPEMVNKDSDLYRAHPDWILQTPQRLSCHGRNQYVLDFSRKEVVDCIYEMMYKILSEAKVSYIKWDMNRSITECYSAALPADRQGEVFHRYILGVYDLYERLNYEEISEVKQQIAFMKEYRELIQFGTFYRLKSPFEGNETAWMTVSEDKKTALVFWYRERNVVNADFTRVRLQGLDPDFIYRNEYNGTENYGDELMNLGLLTTDCTAGEPTSEDAPCTDYESRIYVLTTVARIPSPL